MGGMLWLIVLLPLMGAAVNGFFGKNLPKPAVYAVALGSTGLSFALAVLAFMELVAMPADARVVNNVIYDWITAGDLNVAVNFLLDPLSGLWMLVVTGVGFLIHVYSVGYMSHDRTFWKFFSYLNLFMFSMLMLVLGGNFLLMFIGWEGVGLCSYLLIGYDYHRTAAAVAGKKAFVMNRIGDFGFILAIMLIFVVFGTLDYHGVFSQAHEKLVAGGTVVTAITLLLFLGATGKSAQIPLYTWLPDAMEGPTPVSALIHAATMVTAGVYMLCRTSILFNMAPFTMTVVAVIGCATAVFAATIGLFQKDIKRVLAYSTVSQLGYMFMACGVGAYVAAAFHVMTHAFFKACLFLGSGSVIHSMGGEQNMEKMGALKKHMPQTYWTFLISTLAIAGIFPFAGFFSKDEILAETFGSGHTALWVIATVAAGVTAFYMFRAVFLTFHGKSRVDHEVEHHLHESPYVMTLPLIILAFLATVGGFLGIPIIEGANVLHNFLGPVFAQGAEHAAEHGGGHSLELELGLMGLSLGVAITGIALAYYFFLKNPAAAERMQKSYQGIHTLVFNKYYIDELYDWLFTRPIVRASREILHKIVDVQIIDGLVNGVASFFMGLSSVARRLQSGLIRDYALTMAVAFVLLAGFYLWGGR
ncbi:MAG: NADH-quinone oxidoreductase subunit L [Nitrospinae bacterium]|nr:NADH-quinone oxidoreductase subunit L [Nitrospinota bacterium]